MSTRGQIIEEIEKAPDAVVEEVYDFLRFLKSKPAKVASGEPTSGVSQTQPDFLERQRVLFGERTLPDSQEMLDEIRADRF